MPDARLLLSQDRFAAHIGITLESVDSGHARARLRLGPEHMNGLGIVQGGVVFTLADFAFAAACNSTGSVAVAIDVSISFLKSVTKGELVAEAHEEAAAGRIGTSLVRVTDDTGALVALFKGTAYRKRDGEGGKPAA